MPATRAYHHAAESIRPELPDGGDDMPDLVAPIDLGEGDDFAAARGITLGAALGLVSAAVIILLVRWLL